MGILDKAKPVSDEIFWCKMALYGPPGSGKTTFAASAPSPLILDCEGGTKSLRNIPELAHTPVIQIKSLDEIMECFWELRRNTTIQTVVIDTISELQYMHLDSLIKKYSEKDSKRNPLIPYQSDYRENTEALRQMLLSYRDLEKHVIITAHETEEKDETDGSFITRPSLTPKLSQTVRGHMDVIGHFTSESNIKGEETRYLRVRPTRRIQAKTRFAWPGYIKDPSFKKILTSINTGVNLMEPAEMASATTKEQ